MEITNQEYKTQLREVAEQTGKLLQTKWTKPTRPMEQYEIYETLLDLIEGSDFGRRWWASELFVKFNHSTPEESIDDSFNETAMNLLEVCSYYLGRLGDVSMGPYRKYQCSSSIENVVFHTCYAPVTFKPKDYK